MSDGPLQDRGPYPTNNHYAEIVVLEQAATGALAPAREWKWACSCGSTGRAWVPSPDWARQMGLAHANRRH